jgi:hypothetical protein
MKVLPDKLRYLGPILRELAKLPPEVLDEDVDPSGLEAALRERVKGLSIREATQRLTDDRSTLKDWLKSSKDAEAAASWIIGFLMRPGPLARRLLAPPEAEPSGPAIAFEPPEGWSIERVPFALNLRRGRKNMGAIRVIASFELICRQNDIRDEIQSRNKNPFAFEGKWTKSSVQFGESHGYKYLYTQTTPASWKRVQYLLQVPGGEIEITLDAGGKEFDELAFEGKLQTLRFKQAG